jgi:hypothetical protein
MAGLVDRPSRIFRFYDAKLGAYQISSFVDSAPPAETPLLARTGFITDIEVFADEGWRLANEIGETQLAAQILLRGLDWEHAVANHNGILIPGQPDKVSDPVVQKAIDALDQATEDLIDQLNKVSAANPHRTRGLQHEMEERKEGE